MSIEILNDRNWQYFGIGQMEWKIGVGDKRFCMLLCYSSTYFLVRKLALTVMRYDLGKTIRLPCVEGEWTVRRIYMKVKRLFRVSMSIRTKFLRRHSELYWKAIREIRSHLPNSFWFLNCTKIKKLVRRYGENVFKRSVYFGDKILHV